MVVAATGAAARRSLPLPLPAVAAALDAAADTGVEVVTVVAMMAVAAAAAVSAAAAGEGGWGCCLGHLNLVLRKLVDFEKNLYMEHRDVSSRSEAEVQEYLRRRDINFNGRHVPRPVFTFLRRSCPPYVNRISAAERHHLGKRWGGASPIQAQG